MKNLKIFFASSIEVFEYRCSGLVYLDPSCVVIWIFKLEAKFSRNLKFNGRELFELIEYIQKVSAIIKEIRNYTIAQDGPVGFIHSRIISPLITYRLNSEFKTHEEKIRAIEANV